MISNLADNVRRAQEEAELKGMKKGMKKGIKQEKLKSQKICLKEICHLKRLWTLLNSPLKK